MLILFKPSESNKSGMQCNDMEIKYDLWRDISTVHLCRQVYSEVTRYSVATVWF